MGQAMTDRLTGLSPTNARGVLLGAAACAAVAVAIVLAAAGVATGEVVATVLFLPVFAAGLIAGRTAGYGAAAVATLVYVLLRRSDLSGAGLASAGVVVLTRAGAYAVAGHVGALAQILAGPGQPARPGRATGAGAARPPRPQAVAWDEPSAAGYGRPRDDRTRVLVGVGSTMAGAHGAGGEDTYGDGAMTMSGTWPPDPPQDRPADHVGAFTGGWSEPGETHGWSDGAGDDGRGHGGGQGDAWATGGSFPAAADDDWEAVQSAWRRQNGLPDGEVDDRPTLPRRGGGARDEWPGQGQQAQAHADPWGSAPGNGHAAPPDPWGAPPANGTGRHSDAWGTPAADRGPMTDPWGTPIGPGAPGAEPDPWGAPSPANGGHAPDPWGAPSPANGGHAPDPWGAAPANGTGRHSDPWGAPAADRGPMTDPWGTPIGPTATPDADQGPWSGLTADPWAAPTTGQTRRVFDDPAVAPGADPWAATPPAAAGGQGWPAAPAAAPGPRAGAPAHAAPPAAEVHLPAVDPETGLWTAKFLRDRLYDERSRSRRSGRPFSMVLVQVPDGPLAQLPYRRQVTLLRELGYQFVAGGVVEHLVHVPDQAQHWFAVILPDTDRSGAQVLERRLRLGIGGYLSSRGLPLRDLESASLTAPDDDPAMGQIWDSLIGPDDGSGYSG